MTLFLLGPFTLPFALRSPKLTSNGRWIAAALILVYTIYLGWSLWRLVAQLTAGADPGTAEMIRLMMGRP
ncbi:MAG: hypothetical protein WC943_16125 [Elusimicrobiota bacterium]|jgi:hypothetical protein